jgi:hypothetical protein
MSEEFHAFDLIVTRGDAGALYKTAALNALIALSPAGDSK